MFSNVSSEDYSLIPTAVSSVSPLLLLSPGPHYLPTLPVLADLFLIRSSLTSRFKPPSSRSCSLPPVDPCVSLFYRLS